MSVYPMKGVIDMHVHTNPDLRLRAYDDLELTDAAVKVGARAIVIKTHQGTTMDRAYLCNRYNKIVHGDRDFTMFGSITLNSARRIFPPKRASSSAMQPALPVSRSWSSPIRNGGSST